MERQILFYITKNNKNHVQDFYDRLSFKQAEKVDYVFSYMKKFSTISNRFLKKLKGTKALWEIRVEYENNLFRFLGFFEGDKLIILNHAFTKKTEKTPRKEIKIAQERMEEYYEKKSL